MQTETGWFYFSIEPCFLKFALETEKKSSTSYGHKPLSKINKMKKSRKKKLKLIDSGFQVEVNTIAINRKFACSAEILHFSNRKFIHLWTETKWKEKREKLRRALIQLA